MLLCYYIRLFCKHLLVGVVLGENLTTFIYFLFKLTTMYYIIVFFSLILFIISIYFCRAIIYDQRTVLVDKIINK